MATKRTIVIKDEYAKEYPRAVTLLGCGARRASELMLMLLERDLGTIGVPIEDADTVALVIRMLERGAFSPGSTPAPAAVGKATKSKKKRNVSNKSIANLVKREGDPASLLNKEERPQAPTPKEPKEAEAPVLEPAAEVRKVAQASSPPPVSSEDDLVKANALASMRMFDDDDDDDNEEV